MSASPGQTNSAAGIAQFAYPTSALLSFLAVRSICLYNNHGSFPQFEDAFVRRNVLLGLVGLIITTYAASSMNIFVRVLTDSGEGIDANKSYYLLYASAVWAFEILFWPRRKEYVWYPYLISSVICILGETVILESTLTAPLTFDHFDLISFNIQCFRIASLLLVPAIFVGQKLSAGHTNYDEERRSLLTDGTASHDSSTGEQPSHQKGYGSLGKQIAVRDYAKSGPDGNESSASGNHSTARQHVPSAGAADRILVIENGKAVAFGTPQDIVRAVSEQSGIIPILAEHDTRVDAGKRSREATPIMKEAQAKAELASKSLSTVRETAASIDTGKSSRSPSKTAAKRSSTPTQKVPLSSLTRNNVASSATAQTKDTDAKPEMAMVTPVTVRHAALNLGDDKIIDTPVTAQKDKTSKADTTTPITIRRTSLRRDHSKSPSKSLHASTSSAKLKADVPDFVPRSLRNSTEASACSRSHTPLHHSREGSRSSSPSKIHALAPEFIPRHMRTSTDASTSSGPHSPSLAHAQLSRPMSPLKLHESRAGSPSAARAGSPKPARPDFNSSTNLSADNKGVSNAHCIRHGNHVQSAMSSVASIKSSSVEKKPFDAAPKLSKTHVNRHGRRDMAKSEPASHSQMSESLDGGHDSGEGVGSSGETSLTKAAAPKQTSHRRVTAPSDPPSGVESTKKSIGRAFHKPQRRSRHWRVSRKVASRSGMSSTGGLASESSTGQSSSAGGSFDHQGSVPKAPVTSPSVGPVQGYAYTGVN